MRISDLDFGRHPLPIAIAAVKSRLESALDEKGQRVFQFVKYGTVDTLPQGDEMPCVYLQETGGNAVVNSEQFFIGDATANVSAWVGYYIDDTDADGNAAEVMATQNAITRFFLKQLELPDDVNPDGLTHPSFWRMAELQVVSWQHNVPFPQHGAVNPPVYVTRIDFQITYHNTPTDAQYAEVGL